MPYPSPQDKFVPIPFGMLLDESVKPNNFGGLLIADNVVYRRFGTVGKRVGAGTYGNPGGMVPGNLPIISGKRYYRGRPSTLAQMVVQSNDTLWSGNDTTGAFTSIGALPAGSTPAFFTQAYDGNATNADVLICAHGSGAPKKYDGTTLSQLSASIPNLFTGCEFFHEHVAFWGDPANPDTLYLTDIGNPEGFSFMTTQGGYQIGRGDGDPYIQNATALGNTLFVLKQSSIYSLQGFSFYTGEYAFSVEPVISNIGTSAPHSVATLRGSLYFLMGSMVYRLAPGSLEAEPIGLPIITTLAKAGNGVQSVVRAVAGDFLVLAPNGATAYTGLYMLAVDTGSGTADTILVYDADASANLGKPAWTRFTGYPVGSFIPWGRSGDKKFLYIGDALGGKVTQFGGNPTSDQGLAITTKLLTGRYDFGTPDAVKKLDRIYAEVESNAATFVVTVTSETAQSPASNFDTTTGIAGSIVGTAVVGTAIVGSDSGTSYQSIEGSIDPQLAGKNFQFSIQESSTTSTWELQAINTHSFEETPTT